MNPSLPENQENTPGQEEAKPSSLPNKAKPKKRGGIDKLVMSLIIGAAVGSVVGLGVKEQEKRGIFSSLKRLFKRKDKAKKISSPEEATLKKIPDESK